MRNGKVIRDRMPVSIDIIGNDIRNVDDNCIEADGAMYNIRILRNRCFNQAHRALSAQPLFGGPAYFIGNVVYHAPEGGALKFQANPSGILVYQNTFFSEAHDMGRGVEPALPQQPGAGAGRVSGDLHRGYLHQLFQLRLQRLPAEPGRGAMPSCGIRRRATWWPISPRTARSAASRRCRTTRRQPDRIRHSVLVDFSDFVRASAPDPRDPRRFYRPDEFDFALSRELAGPSMPAWCCPTSTTASPARRRTSAPTNAASPCPRMVRARRLHESHPAHRGGAARFGRRAGHSWPAAAEPEARPRRRAGRIPVAREQPHGEGADPGWVAPKKLVVVVDKPERTAWLQQAMPAGTTVIGVRREAEAQPLLADADAMIEVNCAIAVGDAPNAEAQVGARQQRRWRHLPADPRHRARRDRCSPTRRR